MPGKEPSLSDQLPLFLQSEASNRLLRLKGETNKVPAVCKLNNPVAAGAQSSSCC